jgi:hypothetical protein
MIRFGGLWRGFVVYGRALMFIDEFDGLWERFGGLWEGFMDYEQV